MYNAPIFLQPVLQERIWGGQKLQQLYQYELPSAQTGEAWVISAHPNGPSIIRNGPLEGKTLADAWEKHGELFNKNQDNVEAYPLLVKVLDANDDLSVQVHPDDRFAREEEGEPYGKTECWYVLEAEPGAELVLGHHAKTKAELEDMIDEGKWNNLLQYIPVKAGDFVYVPSGTIHAIGKGIVILETQQSSDITYRVYDYDRTDAKGDTRELHLERAKQVTTVPHKTPELTKQKEQDEGFLSTKLVEEKYFTVYHWKLDGQVQRKLDVDFLQCSVIAGKAEITIQGETFPVEKGEHFILPNGVTDYQISGKAEWIVSHT
ncbi:Putative mannose-6-phosphate isomerase YvyI [Oceanobacillus picturae]|uniref:Mannose-6-phosphate isomerase n=1 Tax=Oceanobacillus picturae TaxID=171693 RepID=W9AD95_9BACI|nr:mannose-6-phosphate isomerase, class I [Oceanobacillus picturae]RIU88770.1 mannose-6-phosphate isomerase, class I [Oceanobacillus picturae]CDO03473.1 Putative mannose-6-phosphate isomerase YvyI [Oceanobacillus picturae]